MWVIFSVADQRINVNRIDFEVERRYNTTLESSVVAGSANGRQTGSEPVNLGSNPSPAASKKKIAPPRLSARKSR